jgi:hypothetical protein
MSAATCPACGRKFHKGKLAMLVAKRARRTRVCVDCARTATLIVAPFVPPAPAPAESSIHDFAGKVARQLRGLRQGATASAHLATDKNDVAHHLGKAEGYEGAIALVKRLAEQEGPRR